MNQNEKFSNNILVNKKMASKKAKNRLYHKFNLKDLENNFKSFCELNFVNYSYAMEYGIENSKKFLKRYYLDEFDGNMKAKDCEILYKLVNDPWNCSNIERHDVLSKILNDIITDKKSIEKILILGAGLGGDYRKIRDKFPNAYYYVTDISQTALNCFKNKFSEDTNLYIDTLDIFSGSSLFNFALKYGKFDLIVASGVFRYSSKTKRKQNCANFLYHHYLRKNGYLSITEVRQDPKVDNPLLLRKKKPILDKKIATKTRINPTQFVIYKKETEII